MDVKVSTKYQIVIPKAVRKELDIKPGQKVHISKVVNDSVTLSKPLTSDEYVKHYSGTLTNTAWQKAGVDAAVWLRQARDKDR